MKRVTPAKLIAASRALIALSDCDDWGELSIAKWEADTAAHLAATGNQLPADWMLPNAMQLAMIANTLSGMLDDFVSDR